MRSFQAPPRLDTSRPGTNRHTPGGRMRSMAIGAVLTILLVPSGAAAQACLGVPSPEGATMLEGVFTTTEGQKTYGARAIFNIPGPAAFFATYDVAKFDDFNERGQRFGGGGAIELQVPRISLCPTAGASYFRVKFEESGGELLISQTGLPVGLAVGKSLPAGPNLYVVLFGQPEFQYIRSAASINDPVLGSDSESDSQNEFGFHFGMRVGTDSFYG